MNLEKYLTKAERRTLETRRAVSIAVSAGWPYSRIVQELRVSPATVSHVKKIMKDWEEHPWKH